MSTEVDIVLRRYIDKLKEGHDCHSFILYGSRISGEASEESDYDLIALRGRGEPVYLYESFQGRYFETYVYPDDFEFGTASGLARAADGVVLEESKSHATDLLASLRRMKKRGPRPLAEKERLSCEHQLEKLIHEMERYRTNEVYVRHCAMTFVTRYLPMFFASRGWIFAGGRQDLERFERWDPGAYRLYSEAVLDTGSGTDRFKKLLDILF